MFLIEKILQRISNSSLITNSLALLILRGTTIGARLIVIFLFAVTSTPSELGVIIYLLSIVEIARYIADFGIDTLAVREFSVMQKTEEIQLFANLLLFVKLVCGFITYSVIVVYFVLRGSDTEVKIALVLSVLIITSLLSNLTIDYFQARLAISKVVAPVVFTNIILVVIIAIMSWFNARLIFIIAILPITEAFNAFVLGQFLRSEVNFSWRNSYISESFRLLHRSLPIALTAIIVALYTRIDIFILNSLLGPTAVGYYGVAFRITEPFQLIVGSFALSIYSHVSTLLASGNRNLQQVIIQYLSSVLVYGVIVCSILILIAPLFVRILLPDYIPAILVLRILAVALIFRTLNTSLTSIIQAYGYFSVITLIALWNLILICVLLLILVYWFGLTGGVLALLIGEIINTLIQSFVVKRVVTQESAFGFHAAKILQLESK